MFVLKAKTKDGGVVYYMNIICITEDVECAEQYDTVEQAQQDVQHFKDMFRYEEIQPEVVEV